MIGQALHLMMKEFGRAGYLLERQKAGYVIPVPSHPGQTMNAINQISVYRTPSDPTLWCFDDARFGLVQELLLHEASAFVSAVAGEKCKRADLIFSTVRFPEANFIFKRTWPGERVREGGCEYLAQYPIVPDPKDHSQKVIEVDEVWLCPAMMHYFVGEVAPELIYGQITPSKSPDNNHQRFLP